MSPDRGGPSMMARPGDLYLDPAPTVGPPSGLQQLADRYNDASAAGHTPELTYAELLALVVLPAVDRIGQNFENLTLRAPDRPDVRRTIDVYGVNPDRALWLSARRGADGLISIESADVDL